MRLENKIIDDLRKQVKEGALSSEIGNLCVRYFGKGYDLGHEEGFDEGEEEGKEESKFDTGFTQGRLSAFAEVADWSTKRGEVVLKTIVDKGA